jgi:hypothetical protein
MTGGSWFLIVVSVSCGILLWLMWLATAHGMFVPR